MCEKEKKTLRDAITKQDSERETTREKLAVLQH